MLTCAPSMIWLCNIQTSLNPLVWIVGFRNKNVFAKRSQWRLKHFDSLWSSAFTRPITSEITSSLNNGCTLHPASSSQSAKAQNETHLPAFHIPWRWKDKKLVNYMLPYCFFRPVLPYCMPVPGSSVPEGLPYDLWSVEGISLVSSSSAASPCLEDGAASNCDVGSYASSPFAPWSSWCPKIVLHPMLCPVHGSDIPKKRRNQRHVQLLRCQWCSLVILCTGFRKPI